MNDADNLELPPNIKPRYVRRALQLLTIIAVPAAIVWYIRERPFGYMMPFDDSRCPPRMAYIRGRELQLPGWHERFATDLLFFEFIANRLPYDEGLRVAVEPFCLDRRLVTTREYQSCVDAGSCRALLSGLKECIDTAVCKETSEVSLAKGCGSGPETDDLPAHCVQLQDARAYCEWKGKALPTEAEWRVASALSSPTGHYRGTDCSLCKSQSHPPDAVGLFDMGHNASEFSYPIMCEDTTVCEFLRDYDSVHTKNYVFSERVIRHHVFPKKLYFAHGIGFRCAIRRVQ